MSANKENISSAQSESTTSSILEKLRPTKKDNAAYSNENEQKQDDSDSIKKEKDKKINLKDALKKKARRAWQLIKNIKNPEKDKNSAEASSKQGPQGSVASDEQKKEDPFNQFQTNFAAFVQQKKEQNSFKADEKVELHNMSGMVDQAVEQLLADREAVENEFKRSAGDNSNDTKFKEVLDNANHALLDNFLNNFNEWIKNETDLEKLFVLKNNFEKFKKIESVFPGSNKKISEAEENINSHFENCKKRAIQEINGSLVECNELLQNMNSLFGSLINLEEKPDEKWENNIQAINDVADKFPGKDHELNQSLENLQNIDREQAEKIKGDKLNSQREFARQHLQHVIACTENINNSNWENQIASEKIKKIQELDSKIIGQIYSDVVEKPSGDPESFHENENYKKFNNLHEKLEIYSVLNWTLDNLVTHAFPEMNVGAAGEEAFNEKKKAIAELLKQKLSNDENARKELQSMILMGFFADADADESKAKERMEGLKKITQWGGDPVQFFHDFLRDVQFDDWSKTLSDLKIQGPSGSQERPLYTKPMPQGLRGERIKKWAIDFYNWACRILGITPAPSWEERKFGFQEKKNRVLSYFDMINKNRDGEHEQERGNVPRV